MKTLGAPVQPVWKVSLDPRLITSEVRWILLWILSATISLKWISSRWCQFPNIGQVIYCFFSPVNCLSTLSRTNWFLLVICEDLLIFFVSYFSKWKVRWMKRFLTVYSKKQFKGVTLGSGNMCWTFFTFFDISRWMIYQGIVKITCRFQRQLKKSYTASCSPAILPQLLERCIYYTNSLFTDTQTEAPYCCTF